MFTQQGEHNLVFEVSFQLSILNLSVNDVLYEKRENRYGLLYSKHKCVVHRFMDFLIWMQNAIPETMRMPFKTNNNCSSEQLVLRSIITDRLSLFHIVDKIYQHFIIRNNI